jgi:hypothetical protein
MALCPLLHMCGCPAAACESVLLDGMWDRGAWLPWLITLLASSVADCLTPAGFSCGRHPLKPSTGRPPTFPACTSALTLAGQPAQLEQRGCHALAVWTAGALTCYICTLDKQTAACCTGHPRKRAPCPRELLRDAGISSLHHWGMP